MAGKPVHVTDAEFDALVLKSAVPVIVDFLGPRGGARKKGGAKLGKKAPEKEGKLLVAQGKTAEKPEWGGPYGG